jgi:hypothetical protein
MLLKWCLSIIYLAEFGNIQNMKVKNLRDPYMLQAIMTIFVVFWLFSSVCILKVEFLIEHSFSKYVSQNGENFSPKKSELGLCLYSGLGVVQPTQKTKCSLMQENHN